jgi:hypothetical protein
MSSKRETLEMVDGRVYYSDDNWATIYRARLGGLGGGIEITSKKEADKIRYLVLCQHSLGAAP